MLALIAGMGDLPTALVARLAERPLICALAGFAPEVEVDITFRIEHLGSFLDGLTKRGVTRVCLAGAIRRPDIDPSQIDPATAPLVPRIAQAIGQGDDGALRIVMALFEERGMKVIAAHNIAQDLLPPAGILTNAQPADWHRSDADVGALAVAQMGATDTGQACVVRLGKVEATEGPDGTEAMLATFHAEYVPQTMTNDPLSDLIQLSADAVPSVTGWFADEEIAPVTADDGILFKAPKPDQDRRADLPVIGPATAMQAAEAGLAGIVVAAGGVMVLNLQGVVETLNAQNMFLWVRP